MDANIDTDLKGVIRPNRKTHIGTGPYWVNVVDVDGTWSEFILYDGDTIIARDNSSMELLEPVYARELHMEIISDQTCKYSVTVNKAKDI